MEPFQAAKIGSNGFCAKAYFPIRPPSGFELRRRAAGTQINTAFICRVIGLFYLSDVNLKRARSAALAVLSRAYTAYYMF